MRESFPRREVERYRTYGWLHTNHAKNNTPNCDSQHRSLLHGLRHADAWRMDCPLFLTALVGLTVLPGSGQRCEA